MSVLRNVIFNVLERVTSTDLNQLQAMAAANAQQALRAIFTGGSGLVPTFLPFVGLEHRTVFAGLEPATTGVADTIAIGPGALLSYQPSYPSPIVGEAFSPIRLYDSQDATPTQPPAVPIPGVGPTWYLLEARVGAATTSAVRDIYNVGTSVFDPLLVPKQLDSTLEYQWVAGADGGPIPNPTSANGWQPVCAVYRTNVGGVVTASQIYDLRLLPSDVAAWPSQRQMNREGVFDLQTIAAPSDEVSIRTRQPALAQGVPLEVGRETFGTLTNLDLSTVLDVNDGAFAASTTYYLYIAGWRGRPMRRLDQPYERGRIVCSTVQPTRTPFASGTSPNELAWTNSSAILDPGPGGGAGPAAGEALLVGAVIRNAGNTGFVPMVQTGRLARIDVTLDAGYFRQTNLGPSSAPWLCPIMAQEERLELHWSATNGVPISVEVQFTDFGGTGFVSGAGVIPNSLNNASPFDYCAAFDGTTPTITGWFISDAAGIAPATYSMTVLLRGWSW